MFQRSFRHCVGIMILAFLAAGQAALAQPGEKVQLEYEGKRLNGWLTEVDSPRATVLMIHGTMAHGNMEIMTTFAEVLAEYDIESLRITLSLSEDDREGMYDCAAEHRHRHQDAIGEIDAWMDWLADHGRETVVLLGHSRGTKQVARYAVRHAPGRAERMILVAPSIYRPDSQIREYKETAGSMYRSDAPDTSQQETAGRSLDEVAAQARRLVDAGRGDTLLEGINFLYCPDATVTANAFLSYYEADLGDDTLALAEAGAAPALVVVGTEDPLSAGVAETVTAVDADDRVSLLVVEGAGHFFRDLYAYDVAEGIVAWLDSVQAE